MIIDALNLPGAMQGQQVMVTYQMEDELKASFILYIIPLLSLLLGAVAGAWLDPVNNQDISAVTGGFGMLTVSYLVIRSYSRKKYSREQSFNPVIESIIES